MKLISVCVPVYDTKYVEETLNAIYEQDYENIEVLISLDFKDTHDKNALTEIFKKYRDKRPTHIFTQEKHVGWVSNCNFLFRQAKGEFISIIPEDDLIPTNYFSILYKGFIQYPDAVNCYPMIQSFGTNRNIVKQESITGSLFNRIIDVINNHFPAVSFRGLINKSMLPNNLLYLDEKQYDDFASDTIQIMQNSIVGILQSVDNVIYKKRYHENNVHIKWEYYPEKIKMHMWIIHCATLFNIVTSQSFNQDERIKIHDAIQNRLFCKGKIKFLSNQFIENNKTEIMSSFDKYLQANQNINYISMKKKTVAVLGSGIQGCLVALMLAKYDYSVILIDKCRNIMMRASYNQEGKIHMGFIYSLDLSLNTGKKLMKDALYFSKYVEYLIEKHIDWEMLKSEPFNYIVPNDSHLSANELNDYFEKLQIYYDELLNKNPELTYLGKKLDKIFNQISIPESMNKNMFQSCFKTEEVAINQTLLSEYIKNALREKNITLLMEYQVEQIKRTKNRFRINDLIGCDIVINCLWESKNVFDQQMGMKTELDTNYRIKFGIVSDNIKELDSIPSYSIVQGPYGDFVKQSNNQIYFSWYPNSMYGMIVNSDIPKEWDTICNGNIPQYLQNGMYKNHLEIFQKIFGREFQFNNAKMKAGIIVANGESDITNKNTLLHGRSKFPIDHFDNYYTISTGKFTSAPYNTLLLEQLLK
jgi:glycosyltransferase involved in cell wall biosynthesis